MSIFDNYICSIAYVQGGCTMLVTDLSTKTFLLSLPLKHYSDNGTNFVLHTNLKIKRPINFFKILNKVLLKSSQQMV